MYASKSVAFALVDVSVGLLAKVSRIVGANVTQVASFPALVEYQCIYLRYYVALLYRDQRKTHKSNSHGYGCLVSMGKQKGKLEQSRLRARH
ncbi:Uncharacterized protein APZ42_011168 [Daphnia magna]|uniref:Uncharacterized protein n=1 Tax=Daphnia magna TaxID=35525 RepID=A0A0P6AZZ7_9CRUS|nr:Uncharacterized protein APZ42_011168 [Daphnia magna]